MSIIYGTLERLETDQQPAVNPEQLSQRPARDKRRQGSLLRSLTTATLFALAAANLVLWYWSHSSNNAVTPLMSVAPAPAPVSVPATVPAHAASTATSPATATATAPESENALATFEPEASPLQDSKDETYRRAQPSNGKSSVTKVSPATLPSRQSLAASKVHDSTRPAAGAVPVSEKSQTRIESVVEAEPVTATPGKKSKVESATFVQAGTMNAHHPSEHTANRFVAAVPQPGPSDEIIAPIDTAVEEARLALSRGRYQSALAALQALQPTPHNRADFWLVKGSAHLGAGQLELAEASLSSARDLAPNNARIAIQMAIVKQEMDDHESALQILGSVADRHPDMPEIFLNQGFSQQATGAETAAKRSFRIFLRLTEGRSLYSRQRMAIEEWLSVES
jgi:tetratricopeptide (TPR) repeat protein